jgi:hypothetical protein
MKAKQLLIGRLVSAVFFCITMAASAHTLSTGYLTLYNNSTNLKGELHLALRDLDDAVGLDVNDDGVITWSELLSRKQAVCAYALSRLHIKGDGKDATLRVDDFLVDNHS